MATTAERSAVRVTGPKGGWRVRYWDSGAVGIGVRRSERHPNQAAATERAAVIAERLALGVTGPLPRHELTLGELAAAWIAAERDAARPGTLSAHRRDLNGHILPALTVVPVRQLSLVHYVRLIDRLTAAGMSRSTFDGVLRTLGALTTWGATHGLLPASAFGTTAGRRAAVTRAKALVPAPTPVLDRSLPSLDDVDELADAVAAVYEHGHDLIWILTAAGLRLGEALGLRHDDLQPTQCTIRVERQADRHRPWPATGPTKTGLTRTALCWRFAQPTLTHAHDRTQPGDPLFPPDAGRRGQPTRWWTTRLSERLTAVRRELGWDAHGWTIHDLRAVHATLSTTPVSAGGFGLPVALTAASLGHTSTRTTADHYLRQPNDPTTALANTHTRPDRPAADPA